MNTTFRARNYMLNIEFFGTFNSQEQLEGMYTGKKGTYGLIVVGAGGTND